MGGIFETAENVDDPHGGCNVHIFENMHIASYEAMCIFFRVTDVYNRDSVTDDEVSHMCESSISRRGLQIDIC